MKTYILFHIKIRYCFGVLLLFLLGSHPGLVLAQETPVALQQVVNGDHDPMELYLNNDTQVPWIEWGENAQELARKLKSRQGEAHAMLLVAIGYMEKEDLQRAKYMMEQTLEVFQNGQQEKPQGEVLFFMGLIHDKKSQTNEGISYYQQALDIFRKTGYHTGQVFTLTRIGNMHAKANDPASALDTYQEGLRIAKETNNTSHTALLHYKTGQTYSQLRKHSHALNHLQQSLQMSQEDGHQAQVAAVKGQIGAIYREKGQHDSALVHLSSSFELAQQAGHLEQLHDASAQLSFLHKNLGTHQQALEYMRVYSKTLDSLKEASSRNAFKRLENDHIFEKELLHQRELVRRARTRLRLSMGGLGTALLFVFVLSHYYRQKKEGLRALQMKNQEIVETKNQLILQEKLAFLGQMAAGIAHEIKNPLNFINNFSEGSVELTEELVEELQHLKIQLEAEEFSNLREIITYLHQNAQEINQNGKRVNRIINSIMEHANGKKGVPQKVNLHKLIDENITLAYQTFQRTTPSFQLELEKNYTTDVQEIEVIPQDLGRVLINLATNACYALNQKRQQATPDYIPKLKVTTRKIKDKIELSIMDNGTGIPEKIRDRIFTPFFTTKSSKADNAGLGLSISYDIIVSQHRGTMEVNSEEGQYTEFVIQLPISQPAISPSTEYPSKKPQS